MQQLRRELIRAWSNVRQWGKKELDRFKYILEIEPRVIYDGSDEG